jgi:hypothetical protein
MYRLRVMMLRLWTAMAVIGCGAQLLISLAIPATAQSRPLRMIEQDPTSDTELVNDFSPLAAPKLSGDEIQ